MTIHKPVLLKEAIESLNLKKGDTVFDATLGGGGHSLEILKKILPDGKLIAIDLDPEAIERFKIKIKGFKPQPRKENVIIVNDNFENIKNIVFSQGKEKIDAVLADFGISSDQLESEDRGFSFQKDSKLDMRMDPKGKLTAEKVVNEYDEKELARIFSDYGGEKFSEKIARSIITARNIAKILKTGELLEIIRRAIPEKYKYQKIHFATRVFQALRIEVNGELENIRKFIQQAIEILRKGGRLSVITFHSGEDKIAKEIFRENARGCICPPETQLQKIQEDYLDAMSKGNYEMASKLEEQLQTGKLNLPSCRCGKKSKIKIITKKPILPDREEVENNPRSRSAKLRVVEKL